MSGKRWPTWLEMLVACTRLSECLARRLGRCRLPFFAVFNKKYRTTFNEVGFDEQL
jgi:hypothetical protein